MIRGGIPQRLQGRIRLECLGQVLRARGTDGVFIEAASERRKGLSMAIDSNGKLSTGSEGAYPSVFRVEFVLSASDRCFAPVGPTLL